MLKELLSAFTRTAEDVKSKVRLNDERVTAQRFKLEKVELILKGL